MTVLQLKQALDHLPESFNSYKVAVAMKMDSTQITCSDIQSMVILEQPKVVVMTPFTGPPPGAAPAGQFEDPADWWKKG